MVKAAIENWPAFNVERRSINELLPYAHNAREHSDEQIELIAAAIREYGFTQPVLIDPDGQIIAGHGRVMALRLLGHDIVPVIVARGWSEKQKQAYVLFDNKITEHAAWNDALLKIELEQLQDVDFDLDLTGFNAEEIDDLLGDLATDPENPGAKKKPKKKVEIETEIWVLGPHKLVTGGSLDTSSLRHIIETWQAYSGREAIRESDGATYADVVTAESAPSSRPDKHPDSAENQRGNEAQKNTKNPVAPDENESVSAKKRQKLTKKRAKPPRKAA